MADDGRCSLREAVSAANADAPSGGSAGECAAGAGADTVTLPAGLYTLTRSGSGEDANATGDIDVTGDLTLDGAGPAASTIDGAHKDRVLDVRAVTVSVRGVTVTGGRTPSGTAGTSNGATGGAGGPAGSGGGILSAGTLTLADSVVADNSTGAGGTGGTGSAVPSATGTGGAGGAAGQGGGIYNSGTLALTNVRVTGNTTGTGGTGGAGHGGGGADGAPPGIGGVGIGGAAGQGGNGGGIENTGTLAITASSIAQNESGTGGTGGAGTGGFGGDSTAATNGAHGGTGIGANGGAGGFGGAISGPGSVTTAAATLDHNRAGTGGSGGDADAGEGGQGGPAGGNGGNGGTAQAGVGGSGGRGGAFSVAALSATNTTVDHDAAGDGGAGGKGFGAKGGDAAFGSFNGGNAGSVTGGFGGSGGSGGGIWTSNGLGGVYLTIASNGAGRGGDGTVGQLLPPGQHGPGGGSNGQGGTSNTSGQDGARGDGGAVTIGAGTGSLANTIVAANPAPACSGVALSNGGHVLATAGDGSCGGAPGDALLGTLADNGGPVQTRALKAGSAARDQVPAVVGACLAGDARGVARPQGAACDIGAYEVAPPGAATGDASAVAATSATLGGSVTPNARVTTYRFEYGVTPDYGSRTADTAAGSATTAVAAGAPVDGLLPSTTYHYRLVATNADGTSAGEDRTFTTAAVAGDGPGGLPDTTAPIISAASVKPRRFAMKSKKGTKFRYTLSEAARVTFTVERGGAGRKVAKKCVRVSRSNRKRPKCTRYARAGSIAQSGVAGANTKAFSGKFGRRRLKPGSYRVTLVATDAAGNHSAAKRLKFTVVRR